MKPDVLKALVFVFLLPALVGANQTGMTKAPVSVGHCRVTLDLAGGSMVLAPKRISGGSIKNDTITEANSFNHVKMKHLGTNKTMPYVFYGVHLTSTQRQLLTQSIRFDKTLSDDKRITVLIEWMDANGKDVRKIRLMGAGLSSLKEEKLIRGSSETPLCDLTFYYEESKIVP